MELRDLTDRETLAAVLRMQPGEGGGRKANKTDLSA